VSTSRHVLTLASVFLPGTQYPTRDAAEAHCREKGYLPAGRPAGAPPGPCAVTPAPGGWTLVLLTGDRLARSAGRAEDVLHGCMLVYRNAPPAPTADPPRDSPAGLVPKDVACVTP
jgi:hypothetical protein